jgi:hypothetical protein
MTRRRPLGATAVQLAWYIERDGAKLVDFAADGSYTVQGAYASWRVPADHRAELDAARDVVYRQLAAKRRAKQ